MLRISKLTDYAMLVMSYMAKSPDVILSAPALSEALHLTVPTVSKVLKMLSEAKLVHSIRGAEGGYSLARASDEVTVLDIIMAIEGDFAMTECCEKVSYCAIDSVCTMQANWKKINKVIIALLKKLTIMDMAHPLSLQGLLHGK